MVENINFGQEKAAKSAFNQNQEQISLVKLDIELMSTPPQAIVPSDIIELISKTSTLLKQSI